MEVPQVKANLSQLAVNFREHIHRLGPERGHFAG